MVNFYPEFVNCSPNATVEQVAGKRCVCVCVCGVCVSTCVCGVCVSTCVCFSLQIMLTTSAMWLA